MPKANEAKEPGGWEPPRVGNKTGFGAPCWFAGGLAGDAPLVDYPRCAAVSPVRWDPRRDPLRHG